MKQIAYDKAKYYISVIFDKMQNNEEYTDQIFYLVELMIKAEIIKDIEGLTFDEFFFIVYNCLWKINEECEEHEDYEVCSKLQQIITNEEEIYRAWVRNLPIEDQDDYFEELEYARLSLMMMRNKEQK